MKLVRVTAVDYITVDGSPVVKVCGRDEDAERAVHFVHGTRPYLYTRVGEPLPDDHTDRLLKEERGFESYDGVPLQRWTCRVPDDVTQIKKDVDETWEADIPYYRRASIDYDLSGYIRLPDEREVHISDVDTDVDLDAIDPIEPRVVYGDIEVLVGDGSFEQMLEDADQPVTAVTMYDPFDDRYDVYVHRPRDGLDTDAMREYMADNQMDPDDHNVVLHQCDTEVALLDSLLGYFERVRPDMTTGWNWVDFDILYLLRRMRRLQDEGADLDLHRMSDAGGVKSRVSDYHGDLARAVVGVPAVDMMKLFFERIEFSEWRSHALDYVADEVVGHGKLSDVNVNEAYKHDRAKLAAYNAVDVKLCVEIDRIRDVIETCMGLAEESQVQIYDVFSEMRLVDGYIMARADHDEVLPNQVESDVPENAGGLVLKPADGISEWVGVMDLKSLYPSAMITWNISPETVHWTDDVTPPEADMAGDDFVDVPWVPEASDVVYPLGDDQIDWGRLWTEMDTEGIVPKYLKLLFKNREDAKAARDKYAEGSPEYETWDRKQYGIKVLMNSFYGVSSNDYWRMATDGLGDAVTSAARYALYKGQQIVEDVGYDTVYGDTDSVFFGLQRDDAPDTEDEYKRRAVKDGKGLTNQVNHRMKEAIRESGLEGDHPHLDGTLTHATDTHCLQYEFEKLYRRYIQFGKKKRYAGLIVWKEGKDVDRVDITGFEAKRSDTPALAADAQEEVLHMVLDGQGFDAVSDYVSGLCDAIQTADVPLARIARPKSLGKALDDYATTTQTVKACRASAEQLGKTWVKGDDPFLVFLERTPPMTPGVSVIALEWNDDLPDGYTIDAAEHIRICLEAPLDPILDEVGWRWKEVKTGATVGNALDDDWADDNEETTMTTSNDVLEEDW